MVYLIANNNKINPKTIIFMKFGRKAKR